MSDINQKVAFKEAEQARVDAELALLRAEADFVAKKQAGPVSMEEKLALRALRQDFRLNYRKPAKEGAQPAAIGVVAKVEEV